MSHHALDKVFVLERDRKTRKYGCVQYLSLAELHNNVPVTGDKFSVLLDQGGLLIREVAERHFLEYNEEKTGQSVSAWLIIVEEKEPDFDLDDSLMEMYEEEFKWHVDELRMPPTDGHKKD